MGAVEIGRAAARLWRRLVVVVLVLLVAADAGQAYRLPPFWPSAVPPLVKFLTLGLRRPVRPHSPRIVMIAAIALAAAVLVWVFGLERLPVFEGVDRRVVFVVAAL